MAIDLPKTVYLAGSTVEVIAALACITEFRTRPAAVFVEHNISFKPAAMKPLLAAARLRFSDVRFVELEIERGEAGEQTRTMGLRTFMRRWKLVRSIRDQFARAIQTEFGVPMPEFGRHVQEVGFTTILHDYVPVFLAACPGAERFFYPHGFDHPRRQLVRDYGYQLKRRSLKTLLTTFPEQVKHLGVGGLAIGLLGRACPGLTTTQLPLSGVDRVLTFRSDVDFVPNETVLVHSLADTFRWLLGLSPWAEALGQRNQTTRADAALLLLPETNRHPIWEENRNFGAAHLKLLQSVGRELGVRRFVIKAHVRSDGSAASWLAGFLRTCEPAWEVELLPQVLHGLPVEALAMTGEFAAGCSLGSCSLPPGLGFGIRHYVSQEASSHFDAGWIAPYYLAYSDIARMLVQESICYEIGGNAQ